MYGNTQRGLQPTIGEEEDDIIYLASAGYDHTIRFWTPHEGKCSRVIQHPHSQVNDLKITPDKTFIAAASFQHVRMYNILTIHNNNPEINLEGFNNNVLSIGFQEDSKWLFSGGEDCVTRVWDLRTRKNQSQRMYESESTVNSVKLHPNQVELFIGQQYGHINIWDYRSTNSTAMVRLEQQHPSINTGVQCLSLNPIEDMLAAIDNAGNVHIFSPAQTLKLYRTWKAHSKYGIKCLFSPNGKYLVTTSADHTAKVWRTCDILRLNNNINSSSNLNNNYKSTNTNNENDTDKVVDGDSSSSSVATSSSSITNTNNNLSNTKSEEGELNKTLTSPNTTTNTTTTTTTTKTVTTTASTTTITTAGASTSTTTTTTPQHQLTSDAASATTLKPFKILTTENQRWVWDVSFSADSQFLVTASSEGVVRLWHVETAEIRREYTGHQKAVTALAFSD